MPLLTPVHCALPLSEDQTTFCRHRLSVVATATSLSHATDGIQRRELVSVLLEVRCVNLLADSPGTLWTDVDRIFRVD